jgi:hypothetical protein
MNERIRELLQETYTHFGHGKYRTDELVAEKFAELIVKECCDIVRQCRFAPDEDAIVNEIVNHFGVDGMSTEDKKTLIKELLGVKNENTNY